MNKTELVTQMSEVSGLTRKQSTEALDALTSVITQTLVKGESVQMIGFGTFEVTTRAAREGINPLTGEKMSIPSSKAPKFKAGKAFKDAVNK